MLTGERPPATVFERVAETAVPAAFMAPLLLMGGGMTLVGLLVVGSRKDISDLWICLPAGLALLSVLGGGVYWGSWRLPQLTITRFAFDGCEVVIETPARGCFARPVGELRSVTEQRGRRKLFGWWLKFDGARSVFLHTTTPNAARLVQEIKPHAGRKTA